jgi:thiamine biosynthesis lipoprotein
MNQSRSQSTRREFLQGKSAMDAAGNLGRTLHAADSTGYPPDSATGGRTYLLEIGRRAMACQFDVFLNAGEHPAGTELALRALDLIDALEDQLSVYRRHSEVSRLNVLAQQRPVRAEGRLFDLIQRSVALYEATDGAFDITAGPLIRAWNRLRREGVYPDAATLEAARRAVGSCHLQLDATEQSVRYAIEGLTIDLGAIGKGYALDRCVELLAAEDVASFLIHGGTSSMVARGTRQSGTDLPGWTVGIQHPLRADRRLAEVQLCDRALGTSGAGTQQVYFQGKRYGHIIDPRSGVPAEGVLSTTVIAPEAALADALSTAFYVLGLERARSYCAAHPDIAALMTTSGQQAGSVELHAINCDALNWRRVD